MFCSRAKTVNENLKMNGALLSRFDLVFILLDKPDELLDKRVSDHIMSVSSFCTTQWFIFRFIVSGNIYRRFSCSDMTYKMLSNLYGTIVWH